jgi:cysteine desulfuration protein SufE
VAETNCVTTSTLLEHQNRHLSPFLHIGDPQQRLACIVEKARHKPSLAPPARIEANRVEGCLVRVWLVPEFRDTKCFFHCDSDAVSLKALGGLLCDLHSGFTPEEIVATKSGALKHLGILHQLAENRQRTLARVEEKIRHFAQEHQTKVV